MSYSISYDNIPFFLKKNASFLKQNINSFVENIRILMYMIQKIMKRYPELIIYDGGALAELQC